MSTYRYGKSSRSMAIRNLESGYWLLFRRHAVIARLGCSFNRTLWLQGESTVVLTMLPDLTIMGPAPTEQHFRNE